MVRGDIFVDLFCVIFLVCGKEGETVRTLSSLVLFLLNKKKNRRYLQQQ